MAEDRFNEDLKVFERRCEDCSRWLGTWEFPKSGRTWVCKVCQGMKAPRVLKRDTIYKEYIRALREVDAERQIAWTQYLEKKRELDKRRHEIVSTYYGETKRTTP